MPLVEFAIIADDLTGALDAAAPFAVRDLDTRVAATLDIDRVTAPMPAVLSVSTNTRHASAKTAAAAVSAACRKVARLEPAQWFKKIDSTLRGNVATEVVAAMAETGLDHAIVCPAVPAQGRTVMDGTVMVDNVPLAETDFVHDAVSPASPEPLADQFRAIDANIPVKSIQRPLETGLEARGIWVVDAANDDDLRGIANWITDAGGRSFAVGAAGLGEALAARFDAPCPATNTAPVTGPILYVVGSRAARTEAQVARLLADYPRCETVDAPAGRFDALAVSQNSKCVVVRIPRLSDDPPAADVAKRLGGCVAELLARIHFGTVFLTGGDTAAAVLSAIDRPVVALDGEIAAGVPLGHVDYAGGHLVLVTKAGGFGRDTLLSELAERTNV